VPTVRYRPWCGGSGQAASPSPCWVCERTVARPAPAVAAVGRALSAQVITQWAAASDIWSRPVSLLLAKVSQAWW
jgi:hypothetical protein